MVITTFLLNKNLITRARVRQWLRALAIVAEDLSSIPGIHTVAHNHLKKSSSTGSDILLWPLLTSGMYTVHIYKHRKIVTGV